MYMGKCVCGVPEPALVHRATRGCSLQICNLLLERKLQRETKGLNLLRCIFMHKDAANDSASASLSHRFYPKCTSLPTHPCSRGVARALKRRPKNKTSGGGLLLMQIF